MCPLRSGGVSFPSLLPPPPLPKQSVSGRLHPLLSVSLSLSPFNRLFPPLRLSIRHAISPHTCLCLCNPNFHMFCIIYAFAACNIPHITFSSHIHIREGEEEFVIFVPNCQMSSLLLLLLIYFTKYPSYFCQSLTCHTAVLSSFENRWSLLLKVTHSPSLFFALSIALSQTPILRQRKSIYFRLYTSRFNIYPSSLQLLEDGRQMRRHSHWLNDHIVI